MEKVSIIGGGGYVGTEVCKYFLKNKNIVNCVDNFIYKHSSVISDLLKNKNFNLINQCMSEMHRMDDILNCDAIIILAGLVGDPITKKYNDISIDINEVKMLRFLSYLSSNFKKKIVFVSTCSNYGCKTDNDISDENSKLEPLSTYAKSKVKIENYILSNKDKFSDITILRFSTAFGLSDRMRFDLTVNEFTKDIFFKIPLVVYDKKTWRPYCHVNDFANLISLVINADKKLTNHEVFNAGSDENHATKEIIVQKITKKIDFKNIKFLEKSIDKRNYKVDFSKVKKTLNFKTNFSIDDGIDEIIEYLKNFDLKIFETKKYLFGNYEIKQ